MNYTRHFSSVVLGSALLAGCQTGGSDLVVIGHRGAMGHVLENTLASIDTALALGVDMIEIDVYRIASGHLVVFHDDTLGRLSVYSDSIEHLTIEALDTMKLHDGHSIPTLAQVIERVQGKVPLNIELKGAGTAEATYALLQEMAPKHKSDSPAYLISSFRWDELEIMRALDADLPIAVLTEEDPLLAIDMARKLGAQAINPYYKNVDASVVDALHQAGFQVFPWTVNEPEDLQAMKVAGVDGLFTNFPERLR